MAKLCELCHARRAAIPDRNRMGRPIKRICRECHAVRLRADLLKVLEVNRKRNIAPSAS
jgi:hypothetical protein